MIFLLISENPTLGILEGLFVAFGMVCVMKYIAYKKYKSNNPTESFKGWGYWLSDNWIEFPVYLFVTWLVFLFDSDFFKLTNYLLSKLGSKYEIIEFDNRSFWFVVTPILLTFLSYRFLRNKTKTETKK